MESKPEKNLELRAIVFFLAVTAVLMSLGAALAIKPEAKDEPVPERAALAAPAPSTTEFSTGTDASPAATGDRDGNVHIYY